MIFNFDWDDDDSIIQHEVSTIAIYPNPRGNVVIRQKRAWDEEDDQLIIISRGNAEGAAAAILNAYAIWKPDAGETVSESRPKDPTAAERQCRRRQRQRDGHDGDNRDDRDGHGTPDLLDPTHGGK